MMHGHSGSRGSGDRQRSLFARPGAWGWRGTNGFGENTPDPQLLSWIQSCLAKSVGTWVPQSGRLGRGTRHALREFQQRQGLPVSGYPDNDTVAQLRRACGSRQDAAGSSTADSQESIAGEVSTSPSPGGCNEDRCTSGYIMWVQQSMNGLGSRLKTTGVLDRTTINALNQFKTLHGVPQSEYYASPVIERALIKAGAAAPPPARRLPCGSTDSRQLLPLLRQYASDIPPEYLLGWISVESGGKLGDLTKICERGYFQIHPEEAQDLRLVDFDRLSTDPAYSVEGGVRLVRKYAAGVKRVAGQFNLNPQGDLFWGLAKLQHWIPSAPSRILSQMRRDSVPVTDWQSIHDYVYSKSNLGFGSFNPREGVDSVSHYLSSVSRWRKILGGGTPTAPIRVPGQALGPAAGGRVTMPPPTSNVGLSTTAGETTALRSAIQQGQRDVNKLTDMLFNRRHPERRGQPLQPGQVAMVSEWRDIQTQLVLPELKAANIVTLPVVGAAPTPAPRRGAKPPSTTSGIEADGDTTQLIPCILNLQDQGRKISFVQRYLRDLSRKEVAALKAAGFAIVSCFEEGSKAYNATMMRYFTSAQGLYDARRAFTQAQAVGQSADRPVYFAVDTDPDANQGQAILDYVQGLSDGYAQYLADMNAQKKQAVTYAIGIYGSGCVLAWCQAQGIAGWFWQAFAPGWCNNRTASIHANIRTSGLDRPERCNRRFGHLEGWGNEGGW